MKMLSPLTYFGGALLLLCVVPAFSLMVSMTDMSMYTVYDVLMMDTTRTQQAMFSLTNDTNTYFDSDYISDMSYFYETWISPPDTELEAAGIDLGSSSPSDYEDWINYHLINSIMSSDDWMEIDDNLYCQDSEYDSYNWNGYNVQVCTWYDMTNMAWSFSLGYGTNMVMIQEFVECGNGIIIKVDKALPMPQKLSMVLPMVSDLSMFMSMLQSKGLLTAVEALEGITIMAPSNAAFTTFMASAASKYSDAQINQILMFHILSYPYAHSSDELFYTNDGEGTNDQYTMNSDYMRFTTSKGGEDDFGDYEVLYTIGTGDNMKPIQVTKWDIVLDNGMMHVIDTVVMPDDIVPDMPTPGASPSTPMPSMDYDTCLDVITDSAYTGWWGTFATLVNSNTFSSWLYHQSLDYQNYDRTVFAPSNDAMVGVGMNMTTTQIEEVLDLHVIHMDIGSPSSWNKTMPTMIKASNDQVLVIEYNAGDMTWWITNIANMKIQITHEVEYDTNSANGRVFMVSAVLMTWNMVDTAGTYDMHALDRFVDQYNLMDQDMGGYLDGTGAKDITVFLPTDKAFDMMTAIHDDDIVVAKSILDYHMVAGMHFSSDMDEGDRYETMDGQNTIQIDTDDDGNWIVTDMLGNDAKILWTNLIFSRFGVIHVIDKVLQRALPPPFVPNKSELDVFETIYELKLHGFYSMLEEVWPNIKMWMMNAMHDGHHLTLFVPDTSDAHMWFDRVLNTYHKLVDDKGEDMTKWDKKDANVIWMADAKQRVGQMIAITQSRAIHFTSDGISTLAGEFNRRRVKSLGHYNNTKGKWINTDIGVIEETYTLVGQYVRIVYVTSGLDVASVVLEKSNYRCSGGHMIHTTDKVLNATMSMYATLTWGLKQAYLELMDDMKKQANNKNPLEVLGEDRLKKLKMMCDEAHELSAFLPKTAAWSSFIMAHPNWHKNPNAFLNLLKFHITGQQFSVYKLAHKTHGTKVLPTWYSAFGPNGKLATLTVENLIATDQTEFKQALYVMPTKDDFCDGTTHADAVKKGKVGDMDLKTCYVLEVETADMITQNGNIHLISEVLLNKELARTVDGGISSGSALLLIIVIVLLLSVGACTFIFFKSTIMGCKLVSKLCCCMKKKATTEDESLLEDDFGEYEANEI